MKVNIYKNRILKLFSRRHLLTIAEIKQLIPQADQSTICRNVNELVKEGRLKKVVLEERLPAYESAKHRHDHFVCLDCGMVRKLKLGDQSKQIEFGVVTDVVVRGVCDNCQVTNK